MNTPAHTFISLYLLDRNDASRYVIPIVLGSLLPDMPMFFFYFVEKIVLGSSETRIWSESYFHPGWQNFFDLFNSIPIIILGLISAWSIKSRAVMFLFGSMLLHIAFDLPLHHDDAHRHFFPFTDWKFESPISYWDPSHYGNIMAPVEGIVVLGCYVNLLRRYHSLGSRLAISGLASIYVSYIIFAIIVWS